MRLRLFDRIRRLAHFRRPPPDAAEVSGAQGRHRRSRRPGPATAPASGEWPAPGGPPGELAHTAVTLAGQLTGTRRTGRARYSGGTG